jgi:LPXTG-motif cell wall-anchored protein
LKKQIVIILWLLLFFGALSPLAEAAVTDGKVQYYYESSTSTSTSHSSSSTTKASASLHSESGSTTKSQTTTSTNLQSGSMHSKIAHFLKTNDQKNVFLIVIGFLILAIAFLGIRITHNRRKK